ncbi:hypothetical protein D5H75_01315 [Bailinhaonella thermotolerans]|uniref:Uncharacterized protein n=1 Tax=Bailinhaonella thermotolerans TaxID=1070861 RepID=A0A3A4BV63_9ACTN|nr:hypothetical protein D5H75_01315 [Bailinhaonella thermotolerans]
MEYGRPSGADPLPPDLATLLESSIHLSIHKRPAGAGRLSGTLTISPERCSFDLALVRATPNEIVVREVAPGKGTCPAASTLTVQAQVDGTLRIPFAEALTATLRRRSG